jgi:hypothetical protein
MSGGFWNYDDWKLNHIADELRREIAKCRTETDYSNYSKDFIDEMSCVYNSLRELAVKLRRIDWVLSADDGESAYATRLIKDLAEIEYDDPAKDVEWLENDYD